MFVFGREFCLCFFARDFVIFFARDFVLFFWWKVFSKFFFFQVMECSHFKWCVFFSKVFFQRVVSFKSFFFQRGVLFVTGFFSCFFVKVFLSSVFFKGRNFSKDFLKGFCVKKNLISKRGGFQKKGFLNKGFGVIFLLTQLFLFCEKKGVFFWRRNLFLFFKKKFSGCFFSEVFLTNKVFLLKERFSLKSGL